MREIEELLHVCRYAGSSLEISQGAGGNVSVKANGSMWIKASGYRLSAVREGVGYLAMATPKPDDLSRSVQGLEPTAANVSMSKYLQSLVFDSTRHRPSLETWFHAVLGRVVLHTHPIYANAFACMEGGFEALAAMLPEPLACVDYAAPGHRLGEAVEHSALRFRQQEGTAPARLMLENHGLIAVADAGGDAIAASTEVLDAGRKFFGALPEDSLESAKDCRRLVDWSEDLKRAFTAISLSREVRPARFERLYYDAQADPRQYSPIVPDDVVCNGPAILIADASQPACAFLDANDASLERNATILLQGVGFVFVARSAPMIDAMEEQLLANVLVRELIARRGLCRPLPAAAVTELLAMESEKHRQEVLATGGDRCRS